MQEKLESIVNAFAKELIRGKVFMKLGRNGRLFYRSQIKCLVWIQCLGVGQGSRIPWGAGPGIL